MFGRRRLYAGGGGVAPFYPVSIPYSARFDSARSCKLTKTPAGAGNRKTFQIDAFVKRCGLGAQNTIFFADGASNDDYLEFTSGDALTLILGGTTIRTTTAIYRDPSQHMHICLMVDTTQATAGDRVKIYINGSLVTAFSATADPAQNSEFNINTAVPHTIGLRGATYANLYISRFVLVEGATPGPFVSASSGNASVYVPKAVSATYGTNGFHLDFANAADLGNDVSGNNNDYTSSGLASTDQFSDTPTNNFCTLNPIVDSTIGLSNGNLTCSNSGATRAKFAGTYGVTAGKHYWEVKCTTIDSGSGSPQVGAYRGVVPNGLTTIQPGVNVNGFCYAQTGAIYNDTSLKSTQTALANSNVLGFALDLDNLTCSIYLNNTLKYTITGMANDTYYPGHHGYNTNVCTYNFGATAFAYTPPTGFKALCSANLPDPSIIDSTKGFDAKTYTGTGSSQNITSFNFQPDLVWLKNRSQADDHKIFDAVRGATKYIESSTTDQEATDANSLTAFLSNGFTLGTGANGFNDNAENFVSWCWKESATYGMDIVSYTGTGVARTIAHSLGAVPEMMIVKQLTDNSQNWPVYHSKNTAAPETDYLKLNLTDATADLDTIWNDALPTASVFSVGTHADVNENTKAFIAYLFRSVPGFSMFGSYTGNGNADGPFVYCGFRPRYVMIKDVSSSGFNWCIFDAARNMYNVAAWNILYANANSTGVDAYPLEFLSNGLKIRHNNDAINASKTYIFAAFAESPFPFNNAR